MMSESWLMWAAVLLYAAATVLFVLGVVFKAQKILLGAIITVGIGLVPQTIAMIIRWIAVGHGPYLGFYESVSTFVWLGVVALLLVVLYRRSLSVAGAIVAPLALVMLGAAMFAPKSPLEITPSLASVWLTVHVVFAQLSYSALLISFALGIVYLIRERKQSGEEGEALAEKKSLLAKLPKQQVLDNLIFRLVAVGFILWTIMMVTGAIWANQAWGRYWGWDAIETWSLITWLVYAVVLHLRLTMGFRGRKFAWCAVIAMPIMLFSLIGVPILYNSIHSAYLNFGK